MKQLLSILATFAFTLGSSLKTDVRLSEGMDTMARKLYHELADLPENLLISPLSIFSAMGLLQRGAPKGSRTQLQLHIATMGSGQSDGLDALSEVLQDYETPETTNLSEVPEGSHTNDTTLRVASALFVDKALGSLKKPFKKDARGKLGAQVKSVDFADATTTAKTINEWVAVKTDNFIPKLVDSKSLDLGASLMVLNAVYFKASWDKPFDKLNSGEGKFRIPQMDGHVVTNMMQIKETLRTADIPELGATLVVLDYADKAYSMMILLPDPDEDLSTMEEKVTSTRGPNTILRPNELMGRARHRFTHLTLPSFSASFETSLVQPFTQLGVTEAFDTRRANFSEITDKEGLAVTNIFHKALIEVDEEGSEAAALTGIVLDIRTARVPQVITVDRPFLFYIYDKEHDVPLFMGRIIDPSNGAAELIQDTPESNLRPGLQEVVTDDDGFETEIIEFRNAVAADGGERRCSCSCTGRASLNCPAEGLVSCAASCGGDSKEHGACIEQCVINCHQK